MVVGTDPFFCGNGCSHRLSLVIGNIGDTGRFYFVIDHDQDWFFFRLDFPRYQQHWANEGFCLFWSTKNEDVVVTLNTSYVTSCVDV